MEYNQYCYNKRQNKHINYTYIQLVKSLQIEAIIIDKVDLIDNKIYFEKFLKFSYKNCRETLSYKVEKPRTNYLNHTNCLNKDYKRTVAENHYLY